MKSIREAGARERSKARRDLDPYSYVSCWTEDEVMDNQECKALVLILATKGCSWALRSGCSMCGYTNESSSSATDESLWQQYLSGMKNFAAQRVLKIYTSGSFLDTFEISLDLRKRILQDAFDNFDMIVVETRHEYINRKNLEDILPYREKLVLAVGVESSNDLVVHYSVNKPSLFTHFISASSLAHSMGFRVKSYMMFKPPFMSESDAIRDAVNTIRDLSQYSDVISINPTNIQRDTVVELLWKSGAFRPPWLWSLVEVIRSSNISGPRLMSKPTGAGTVRGAHNCGRCDERVLKAISSYSVRQSLDVFEDIDCSCRKTWERELMISRFGNYFTESNYRIRE
ncbi:MAG: archaeosine biosynthesis radical SAM protein RaSEA [Thermoplasmata archaeon]|uniref:Archaeosine biosynthesis radical SAM protein RaSEA n=1 Tax=Candidatus Sysuiplasma superficiale TaxID=2823368 RepID=A0A8J8CHB6_9ARCH|nr:archaeosine biosynthesis radical SAM protein RaSEA [Candidatus Sysuiplasma superficiale]MBX8643778.1 archaeosine biosynthesis radical SAM protein RaSEA [Candidatus Sysuiplasma superficiale]MCL4346602.1 archaeosine biosynthesis radical SAM protein RaSEA [Candidatus Thermoplasmatota archaeon]